MSFLRAACRTVVDRSSAVGGSLRTVVVRLKQTAAGKQTLQFKLGKPQGHQVNVQEAAKINQRFASDKYKAVAATLMTTATTVTFLVRFAPHSFQQDNIQRIYQHFTQGYPTKLANMTKVLVSEVMEEMKLTEHQVDSIKFFIGCSTDAYGWGNMDTKYGMRIMLPEFMNYDKVGDVKIAEYRFGYGLSSDQESTPKNLMYSELEKEEVKMFAQNLVLSEKAKKFLVARELEKGKTNFYMTYSFIAPVCVFFTYVASRKINTAFRLFHRRPIYRPINYLLSAFTFGIVTLLTQDYFRKKAEGQSDEAACQLGKEYAEGGVEYYTKTIRKNQALRVIMPNEAGKKIYNLKGEAYSGLFRNKYLKLGHRKDTCLRFCHE